MCSLEEFIIAVYCVVDDFLVPFSKQYRLRKKGFTPAFSDSETITLLLVGEFLGLDTDKSIHAFFRRAAGELGSLVRVIAPHLLGKVRISGA